MTTQSVMAQAANSFSGVKGSVNGNNRHAGTGFEALLGSNMKTDKTAPGVTENSSGAKKTATDKASDVNAGKQDDNTAADDKVNAADSKTTEKDNTADASSKANAAATKTDASKKETAEKAGKVSTDGQKADPTDEETPADEQQIASLIDILNKVQEVVMQLLNLTPEQFSQLLDKYQAGDENFNQVQLLQPDTIRQMVLLNSGITDPFAVLTNEDLAGTMKLILSAVEQIKSKADLPFTMEQLKKLLDQVKTQTEPVNSESQDNQKTADMQTVSEAGKEVQPAQANKEPVKVEVTAPKEELNDVTKPVQAKEQTTDGQGNAGKQESNSFGTADPFQAFVEKMVQSTQPAQQDFSGELVQVTNLREIVSQMVERIKVMSQPGQTSMELQLTPEELGKVNLTVQSKDGVMSAQFVVQNELSKEALESQMQNLKDSLNQQGIKVDSIEVTVEAYAFNENAPEDQNSRSKEQKSENGRKITLEEAFSMQELPEEEITNPESDGMRGSQIDTTA